ncbi:MAG TPA: DUF3788 domain-containing protein [Proteiniclasticum sp.]|nr:DUF3788 domain-containing protein [Proteiniclasticum sp.]
MSWNEIYDADHVPSSEEIREYLGKGESLWDELTSYIEEAYQVKPQITYSKCSAQPGWNVKYRKGSRSLCTLYPMAGYFITLVVVGSKEEEEVRTAVDAEYFTAYVKELYDKTRYSAMGRWLMIEVKDKDVLDDIRSLLSIRIRPQSVII